MGVSLVATIHQPKQGGLGLTYVPAVLNGKKVSMLVDTGQHIASFLRMYRTNQG